MATTTGWACGYADKGIPVLGHIRLPSTKKDLGRWTDAAIREYGELLDTTHPDRVVYESPFLGGKTSLITLRKLYTLASVIEYECMKRKIPVSEVAITTVKKALTGSGRADKEQMLKAARAKGVSPENYDQADAFGIWYTALKTWNPDAALRFDKDLLI